MIPARRQGRQRRRSHDDKGDGSDVKSAITASNADSGDSRSQGYPVTDVIWRSKRKKNHCSFVCCDRGYLWYALFAWERSSRHHPGSQPLLHTLNNKKKKRWCYAGGGTASSAKKPRLSSKLSCWPFRSTSWYLDEEHFAIKHIVEEELQYLGGQQTEPGLPNHNILLTVKLGLGSIFELWLLSQHHHGIVYRLRLAVQSHYCSLPYERDCGDRGRERERERERLWREELRSAELAW